MLAKVNKFLNIIMGAQVGVLIGHALFTCSHYKNNPDMYAMQSAPWYTSIIMYGTVTGSVIFIAIVFKYLVNKLMRKRLI